MLLHITWISASFIVYTLRTASAQYCPDGEFTCTDGQCIEYDRSCDGRDDCTDGLDEFGCGLQDALPMYTSSRNTDSASSSEGGIKSTTASNDRNRTYTTIADKVSVSSVCNGADLGLVIDSSSSIIEGDFKNGLSFLTHFLSFFDIGPRYSQFRVAAVTYGEGVYANASFSLDTYISKEEVLNAIRRIPYHAGGSTDTGQAIQSMRKNQMSRAREFPVRKIMIVLTDGNSQKWVITAQEANITRQHGFTIFSVGVGKKVFDEELMNIAGSQDRILKSDSYAELRNIQDALFWKVCGEVVSPGTFTEQKQQTVGIFPEHTQQSERKFPEHTQSTETPVPSATSITTGKSETTPNVSVISIIIASGTALTAGTALIVAACRKWGRTTRSKNDMGELMINEMKVL